MLSHLYFPLCILFSSVYFKWLFSHLRGIRDKERRKDELITYPSLSRLRDSIVTYEAVVLTFPLTQKFIVLLYILILETALSIVRLCIDLTNRDQCQSCRSRNLSSSARNKT